MLWYLLLLIPALIAALFFLPVYISLRIKNGEPRFRVKLWFINITPLLMKRDIGEDQPDDGNSKKSDKLAKKEAAKEEKKERKKQELSIGQKLDNFRDTVTLIWRSLKDISRKLTVTHFKIHCMISTDDAARTAVMYGSACAAVGVIEAFVDENFRVKYQNIYIYPNFEQNKSRLDAYLRIRIMVYSLAATGIKALARMTKQKFDKR